MFKGLFRKSSGSTPPSSPPTSPSTPSPDSKRGKLENVSPSSVSSSPRESFLNTSLDASEDRTPTSPFNYNANGEAIDPIIEHLSSSDTYLTCGQFIKVKREFAEAIQSKETVLVFCKEAVYNIRMPTYLQRQFRPFSPSDEDCVDSPKGFGTGGAYDENYRQRRRRNSGIPNAPILRGSGNLRISASPTAGYTGVTARRRPKIGWRVHYSFLHSIEPSLRFGSMFTIHFYNFQKSKTSDGLVSKTYECENRAERDEWLVVLRGILQEFQQLFFEKLIVPHPEVYQYHVWLQKPSSKKRNHRCLILSTDQLYLVDLLPGEDSLRGISEKIIVPIEAIELKFLCNTPGAFILEFDRKVLANVKMRPIEKQKLHCRDGLELIEVIKSIVDLYHRRTRRVPPLQKVNNEEQI